MDETNDKRYKNSIDTVSLHETDAVSLSAEEIAEGDLGFIHLLAELVTDRQRFIALALYHGWNKVEIGQILHVDPSDIVYHTRRIRQKLAIYHIRYRTK